MNAVLSASCYSVLAGICLVAFGALFGRMHPLIDSLAQFLLPAIVGAAVLALLAFLTARYTTGIVAIAALLLNLAIVWPWVQDQPTVEANGPRFKLLLLNVFYNNPRLDLVAPLARKTNADVVVLLEIIPRIRAKLSELDAEYPYRIECWQGQRCDALILSRFPLTDNIAALPAAHTNRSLGSVAVDVNGRQLNLFAAHLTLPFPFNRYGMQPAQAAEVADAVKAASGARLLVGDFNAASWGATMRNIRDAAGLTTLTGAGGSWPSFLPRQLGIPIDHVLASPELALVSRELIAVTGSDHRAVLAEIAFKD
jgi:endonuclease/exonuclease/phosphatase (EEP) superfamily protein YafD